MVENNWPIFVCFVSSPLFSRCGIQTCDLCLIVLWFWFWGLSISTRQHANNYSHFSTSWLHLTLGFLSTSCLQWAVTLSKWSRSSSYRALPNIVYTGLHWMLQCCHLISLDTGHWWMGGGGVMLSLVSRSADPSWMLSPVAVSWDNEPRVTDIYRWQLS